MSKIIKPLAGILMGGLACGAALAGTEKGGAKVPVAPEEPRDWCDAFKIMGGPVFPNQINDKNWLIQEFEFMGRVQWQWANVDGDDVNGDDFDRSITDWRRVRIGAQGRVLDYLSFKANINLVRDGRQVGGNSNLGFQSFDELKITADIGRMMNIQYFDALKLTWGRHKFNVSEEVWESSKKIKTIERSAIANKAYGPQRLSGFTLDAEKDEWSYTLGLFGEFDLETVGWFDNGFSYYLSLGYEPTERAEYIFDAAWADYDEENILSENFGYDWIFSLSGRYDFGKWEFMWNAIYGDNGGGGDRGGDFYGLVLMPSYWILDDTLEAVFRYQFQGAEEDEGIRLNGRYVRRTEALGSSDVNSGRGDEHHSFYLGLNWYICDHNLKLMTGIEYDDLEVPSRDSDVEAWTYFFGARTYF